MECSEDGRFVSRGWQPGLSSAGRQTTKLSNKINKIILIGPPASGKTTVGRYLAGPLGWPLLSDINALLELKELHRDPEQTALSKTDLCYWPEFGAVDSNVKQAMFERFRLTLREDGFEIDEPEIWDEALRRCILGSQDGPFLIEFARGRDTRYLNQYGITERDVYARSFRILPIKPTDSVLVVELFCSLASSQSRNKKRIAEGERGVSDRSMTRIYGLNPLENGGREHARDVVRSMTPNGWSEYRIVNNDGDITDLMATIDEILEGYTFFVKKNEDSKRVGVVVPSMNVVVEEELPKILSHHPVVLHWSRVGFKEGVVPDEHNYIEEYLRNLPTATNLLMDVPVDQVYFACTSASVRMPKHGGAASIVTAWDCMLMHLERLRITEVSLLTPYPVETEREFLTALDERGISVKSVGRLNYAKHFRDVEYKEITDCIARLTPHIPVLLPCTAVRTIEILATFNGQPLITAVSAMAAHVVDSLDATSPSGEIA